MSVTTELAKHVASLPLKPKPSSELKRFRGSVFDKLRKRGKPIMVLAPLANVTGAYGARIEPILDLALVTNFKLTLWVLVCECRCFL